MFTTRSRGGLVMSVFGATERVAGPLFSIYIEKELFSPFLLFSFSIFRPKHNRGAAYFTVAAKRGVRSVVGRPADNSFDNQTSEMRTAKSNENSRELLHSTRRVNSETMQSGKSEGRVRGRQTEPVNTKIEKYQMQFKAITHGAEEEAVTYADAIKNEKNKFFVRLRSQIDENKKKGEEANGEGHRSREKFIRNHSAS